MADLLHVAASPLSHDSHSKAVAQELIQAWRERHPSGRVETVDVWQLDMPEFDATMIAAKFAVLRAGNATQEQRAQWARAVRLAEVFNRATHYVFSLPMWNHGIPYRLKHYIDVITLPGQNWTWSRAEGYRPLLRDKKAILVCSSAGDFSPEAATQYEDYQKPYMRQWLRFIGVDVVHEIAVAPTLTDPANLARIKAAGLEQARHSAALL